MTTTPRHLRAVDDQTPKPTTYSASFRSAAVARAAAGEPVATLARELGVARNTLKTWIRTADQTPAPGQPPVDSGIVTAAASSSLRELLVSVRTESAERIAAGVSAREFPGHARLLIEVAREIEALDEAEKAEQDTTDTPDEPLSPEDL